MVTAQLKRTDPDLLRRVLYIIFFCMGRLFKMLLQGNLLCSYCSRPDLLKKFLRKKDWTDVLCLAYTFLVQRSSVLVIPVWYGPLFSVIERYLFTVPSEHSEIPPGTGTGLSRTRAAVEASDPDSFLPEAFYCALLTRRNAGTSSREVEQNEKILPTKN